MQEVQGARGPNSEADRKRDGNTRAKEDANSGELREGGEEGDEARVLFRLRPSWKGLERS